MGHQCSEPRPPGSHKQPRAVPVGFTPNHALGLRRLASRDDSRGGSYHGPDTGLSQADVTAFKAREAYVMQARSRCFLGN